MNRNPLKQVGTEGQKRATRALAKFCREHGHAPAWVERLENIGVALEARDIGRIQSLVDPIRRAGMGSFHDWFPKVAFPNEDDEYVESVLQGLYGYWSQMMSPILKIDRV